MKQTASPQKSFFIPDLCQTTPLLFLILISELLVLAWEFADFGFSWHRFGFRSISIQWSVLLSAAALCKFRPFLPRYSERVGWLFCFSMVVGISVTVVSLGLWVLNRDSLTMLSIAQIGMAIGIIAAMVLRFFQLQQQVIDHHQAELSSRMDALQARIKPHFLFNSLNTIAELIVTRPEAAEEAVENLSSLFRANLKEKSSFSPLYQELKLVKGYLELEKWRLGHRLTVEWKVSITDRLWPVPVLCLQPLVENAVLHGVASQTEGGTIIISALQTPRVTTLTVENSLGAQSSTHKGHGVGLENVQHRLRVLYGTAARCRVEKSVETYKVTVTVPKIKME